MKIDDKNLKPDVNSEVSSGNLPTRELALRLRNPSLSPVHEVIDLVRQIGEAPSGEGTDLVLGLAKRIFAQEGEQIAIYKDNELQRICLAYLFNHAREESIGVAQVGMASNDPEIKAQAYLIVCSGQHNSVVKEMLRNLDLVSRATVLGAFLFSGDHRLAECGKEVLDELRGPDLGVLKGLVLKDAA
jgi:hypothetical protein